MARKVTTSDFIRRSRLIHGDKYDYSEAQYVKASDRICIICPEHGPFYQAAYSHLRGCGCPQCSTEQKKSNTEEFIRKAIRIHGNKYDYSNVVYTNNSTEVKIICPEHGEFFQTPSTHLSGHGCPTCGGNVQYTTESFIKKARTIFGDKYDYSKVEYSNAFGKVSIICPIHGMYVQSAYHHLSGHGCPKCAGTAKYSSEEFIAAAHSIHGDKYDYSKVNYVDSQTKVIISCPTHGDFSQKPNSHLSGRGCPLCNPSHHLTQEEYISKARLVHGDKYGYHNILYKNSLSKIQIICPTHGEYLQSAGSHLSGHGCPRCAAPNANLTKELFIEKAQEVHGNKYTYDSVEYTYATTKVCITCPNHGDFWQTPSAHLLGQGCPICGGSVKSNTKEFIIEARKVHGEKYDYSRVNYVNRFYKVCISCPTHGDFWQSPGGHLLGHGCPDCSSTRKLDTMTFIDRARDIHGLKYDYSKVEYQNNTSKVCITCPEHGDFWQAPSSHLSGHGCPMCYGNMKLTTDLFIQRARHVHGEEYDYSRVNYINNSTRVEILCAKHGIFLQKPNVHLNGSGCPICASSHLEDEIRLLLRSNGIDFVEQQTFDWLKYKENMYLDFYIPRFNCAIECQGSQHFEADDFFGGEEGYFKIIQRDYKKRTLCEQHGIKMMYYSNLGIDYPYDVIEDKSILLKQISE